ncbi:MAG: hypothetical protein IIB28_09295 [Chloroflexi bacterium]|nr:hypothetical protein [Chloroflexota bacterium]
MADCSQRLFPADVDAVGWIEGVQNLDVREAEPEHRPDLPLPSCGALEALIALAMLFMASLRLSALSAGFPAAA